MKMYLQIIKHALIAIFIIAFSISTSSIIKAGNPDWMNISISEGVEVIVENDEFIWIGTTNPPYNSLYPEILQFQKSSESIVGKISLKSRITLLDLDSEGYLWIVGSMGPLQGEMGLSKYDGTTLTTWTPEDLKTLGFPSTNIRSMKTDDQGNIWFGMSYGTIIKFDGTQTTIYNSENSNLPSGLFLYVSSINFDSKNNVWISIYQGGIAKFENDEWIVFDVNNSEVPTNDIRNIKFDSQDNLWLATDIGLVKYDNQNWTLLNDDNSNITVKSILNLDIDLEDNIWFFSSGPTGVFKYDGNTFTNYLRTNSELMGNTITCIYVDSHNNKWLGVIQFGSFTGLNIFKEGGVSFSPVNVEESEISDIPVYPNPTSDFITIQFSNKGLQPFAEGDKVQIIDVLGIEVGQSSLIDGNNRIDISHLPAGVYFIRIGDKVEKFVKM
ncbi:MAG: two-component regulator propeller domain-containing protein [Candidatus Kapaibacterium sp.]